MAGISFSLDSDKRQTDLLTNLRSFSKNIYRTIARDVLPPYERELDRIFNQAPPKPDYPIQWASERQRRYVLAKLRREGNLPYRRTGALIRNWQIVSTVQSGSLTISIENPTPYAEYVYGPRQQPFLNKWPDAQDKLLDVFIRLQDDIEAVIDRELEKV